MTDKPSEVTTEEMRDWVGYKLADATYDLTQCSNPVEANTHRQDGAMLQAILSLIERSGESDPMGCPSYGPQAEPTPKAYNALSSDADVLMKDAPPESAEEGVDNIINIVECNIEYDMNDNPVVSKQGRYEIEEALQKQGPSVSNKPPAVSREWVGLQADQWHKWHGERNYFDPMERKSYIGDLTEILTEAGVEVKGEENGL